MVKVPTRPSYSKAFLPVGAAGSGAPYPWLLLHGAILLLPNAPVVVIREYGSSAFKSDGLHHRDAESARLLERLLDGAHLILFEIRMEQRRMGQVIVRVLTIALIGPEYVIVVDRVRVQVRLHRVRRVLIALVDERLEGLLRIVLFPLSVDVGVLRSLVVVLVEVLEVDGQVPGLNLIFRLHA